MSNVDDVIGQLDRLITDINLCMTNGAVSDVEKQEFALLQKQYVETLSTFQFARAALAKRAPAGIATISPEEDDAISILWAQGKAQTAVEHAKQLSDETVSAMPVASAVPMASVATPNADEREV